jgi:hypothetical protein
LRADRPDDKRFLKDVEVLAFARSDQLSDDKRGGGGGMKEIPAFAGIEMRNHMINDSNVFVKGIYDDIGT